MPSSKTALCFCIAALFSTTISFSQLASPGKLSSVHEHIEGVSNCTKCHNFGSKTFRDNCLACHKEIKSRIDRGLGYHSHTKKLECSTCHKEHHGRDFKLVRWDQDKFDHRQTGFELRGSHVKKECRKCHKPENIVQPEMRIKSKQAQTRTFLGLEPDCDNCHFDEHRGQFKADCARCHNENDWKQNRFDHAAAKFRLIGKHTAVECEKCHPTTPDAKAKTADREFRKFKSITFSNCTDCHEDHHKGAFGKNCASCHTPVGWKSLRMTESNFDHAKTRFPLHGKHNGLPCASCHIGGDFLRFKGKELPSCTGCHQDYHAGQFAMRGNKTECSACHTVEGFVPSLFTVENHTKTRFPLTGSHGAVACNSCHKPITVQEKVTRQFVWNSFACVNCHQDPHAGQFDKRPGEGGCASCHTVESWHSMTFDHRSTDFVLTGKHLLVACDQCHKTGSVNGNTAVVFDMGKAACMNCHEDVHTGQLAGTDGKTVCDRCHSPEGWKQVRFDHATMSQFPLTGKHAELPCSSCHQREQRDPGKGVAIRFKPIDTRCSSCHTNYHE